MVETVVDGSASGSSGPVSPLWVTHRIHSLSPGDAEDVPVELSEVAATTGLQPAVGALLTADRATDTRDDR